MPNEDFLTASYLTDRTCIMCGNPDGVHDTPEGYVCSSCFRNGNYLALTEFAEDFDPGREEELIAAGLLYDLFLG